MAVYVIALTKGGSGKTTTAAELVRELTQRGRRVLGIDLDRQGNFSSRLGVPKNSPAGKVAADLLTGAPLTEVVEESPTVPGASVVRGNHELGDVAAMPEIITALRDVLPEATGPAGEWDDVVIDTPPSGDTLIMAALAAADVVIVPVEAKGEAYEAHDELEEFIRLRVAKRLNPGLAISWVIPTLYRGKQELDTGVVETLQERLGARVTDPVRDATVVGKSYLQHQPVGIYAPKAPVVADYTTAFAQILGPRA